MILYRGPSQIDGAPIVAVATIDTKNPKTGDMVQVWILHDTIAPHIAVKMGADRSICGDCPQRHYLGGACYVSPFQAPLSVWRRYKAGGYDDPKWIARVEQALRTKEIRLGAYGDPFAVPFGVWEDLLAQGCGRWSGYTHQWTHPKAQAYRGILMASCDSAAEATRARAQGWRFFLVLPDQPFAVPGVVPCLSEARGMTCAECAICDGTRADSRAPTAASVAIAVHGQRAARFKLAVLR